MELSPQSILTNHQKLIDELIPYQLEGRLKSEIESLRGVMPLIELKLVEREVKRLCLPCREHLDLSRYSNLTVESFNHSGCEIVVCQVGRHIFDDQLKRFSGKYTIGVYEATKNKKKFQQHLDEHRKEKIREAFTIPTEKLTDKLDPTTLKLAPDIQLTLPGFKRGGKLVTAQCHYLTPIVLVLEFNKEFSIDDGSICKILYPAVDGLTDKPQVVQYKKKQMIYDSKRESYLVRFAILKRELIWAKKIKTFMEKKGPELPAILPQETKRSGLDLAKAQLLATSDWVPVFCSLSRNTLSPISILKTPGNAATISNLSLNDEFVFSPSWLPRLTKQLIKSGESDLLWLRRAGNTYVATLDEAKKRGQLDFFINPDTLKGDLQILKCRLVKLSKQDHASVLSQIKGAKRVVVPHINSILYIKDMARLSRKFTQSPGVKYPPPADIFEQSESAPQPVQLLVSKQEERRHQSRYHYNAPVTLRSHLILKFSGSLIDLSIGGMKIELNHPLKNRRLKYVRVDVQSLQFRKLKRAGVKFKVLEYIPEKRWLRLQVMHKHQKLYEAHINKLFISNSDFFEERNTQLNYRTLYDAMSMLASHRHPGVHIRLKQGRIETRRLAQVLLGDLFSDGHLLQGRNSHQTMLHRIFADQNAEYPSSTLLNELFQSTNGQIVAVFKSDPVSMALTRIRPERLEDNLRHQLVEAVDDKVIALHALCLSVDSLDALEADSVSNILHRLAKLGATELALAKQELMSVKHNLSITDVSPLFIELLRRGKLQSEKCTKLKT